MNSLGETALKIAGKEGQNSMVQLLYNAMESKFYSFKLNIRNPEWIT